MVASDPIVSRAITDIQSRRASALSPEERTARQIGNYETRLGAVGETLPKPQRSPLEHLFGVLTAVSRAEGRVLGKAAGVEGDTLKEAVQNLAARAGVSDQPMFDVTVPKKVPVLGGTRIAPSPAGAIGTAAEMFNPTDPINWLGFGLAGKAAKGAVRPLALRVETPIIPGVRPRTLAEVQPSKLLPQPVREKVGKVSQMAAETVTESPLYKEAIRKLGGIVESDLPVSMALRNLPKDLSNTLTAQGMREMAELTGERAALGTLKETGETITAEVGGKEAAERLSGERQTLETGLRSMADDWRRWVDGLFQGIDRADHGRILRAVAKRDIESLDDKLKPVADAFIRSVDTWHTQKTAAGIPVGFLEGYVPMMALRPLKAGEYQVVLERYGKEAADMLREAAERGEDATELLKQVGRFDPHVLTRKTVGRITPEEINKLLSKPIFQEDAAIILSTAGVRHIRGIAFKRFADAVAEGYGTDAASALRLIREGKIDPEKYGFYRVADRGGMPEFVGQEEGAGLEQAIASIERQAETAAGRIALEQEKLPARAGKQAARLAERVERGAVRTEAAAKRIQDMAQKQRGRIDDLKKRITVMGKPLPRMKAIIDWLDAEHAKLTTQLMKVERQLVASKAPKAQAAIEGRKARLMAKFDAFDRAVDDAMFGIYPKLVATREAIQSIEGRADQGAGRLAERQQRLKELDETLDTWLTGRKAELTGALERHITKTQERIEQHLTTIEERGARIQQRTEELVHLPKALAEHLNAYAEAMRNPSAVMRAMDYWMGVWKTSATVVWPRYWARNKYSDGWQLYLAKTDFAHAKPAAEMLKKWQANALDDAGQVIIDDTKRLGVLNQGMFAEVAEHGDLLMTGRVGRALRSKPVQKIENLGRMWVDNHSRLTLYLDRLAKGMSPEEAAAEVKKFLFDYWSLTPWERKYMKRLVPFWSWTRFNLPLQLQQLATRPGKFAQAAKAQQIMAPGEEETPSWMRAQMPFKLPGAAAGNVVLGLPYVDINRATSTKELWNMLNPAIKTVSGLAFNRDPFTGRSIQELGEKRADAVVRFIATQNVPPYSQAILPILKAVAPEAGEPDLERAASHISNLMLGAKAYPAEWTKGRAEQEKLRRLQEFIAYLEREKKQDVPTLAEIRR